MAAARKLACNMKTMFATIENKQNNEKAKQSVATMTMPDGTAMPMGSM